MKKNNIIYIFIFFIILIICFTFSFLKIKSLENKNLILDKKISILEKKYNWYKDESIFYKNWYLQIQADFFKNYENNLLNFKNYLKEIGNTCKNKKVCINLLELDISFLNNNDIEKFLNNFSLKNVFKLRISTTGINEGEIKKFLKNLNYQKLKFLHLDIEQVQWGKIIWDIKNFINNKKDINLLETLTIENIWINKLTNSDIVDLSKLKVKEISFLWYPILLKDILKILNNSEYLYKINISDWVNYNWKKAFYFIKRNWKIYIYDNLWRKI